jgi:type VII secretion-associated serine protease mycosin
VQARRAAPVRRARLAVGAVAGLAALLLLLVGSAGATAADGADAYLISMQPGADDGAGALFASLGLRVLDRIGQIGVYRVGPAPGTDAQAALARLGAQPGVRAVEPDEPQFMRLAPDDPLYKPFQWNLRRIAVEQAWDLRPSAPDVVVAVLDTGVDFTHPDLRPNLMVDQGYDFINDGPNPQDDESHGTAVAGIIGAVGGNHDGVAGIAWRVRILPIKALNAEGRGPDSAMVKAILYAADNGARIINISSTGARYSAALETAVAYARGKGALVVAAAGNTGDQDNTVSYPAAFDGVLAVSAVDDQDQPAPFSQHGPYVALAAPGVEVPSTAWTGAGRGAYASQSGTSIAAPHVSGVAALLWALRPDLSAADIATALRSTADPPSHPASDGIGSGVVNAARAVGAVRLGLKPRSTDSATWKPRPATGSPPPAPPPLPAESRRWYFAEGSTKPPFEAWFALQNPNPKPATAHFLFLAPDGKLTPYDLRVEAGARAALAAGDVMPNAEFGTVVQTDLPVYVERTMYFGHGGHTAAGARQPSKTWYLAEGSTVPPFDTWLLLLNPNPSPASVKMTFLREDGSLLDHTEVVPGSGRRSVYVNSFLAASGFATQVQADQPVVVERAMYFDARQGGHDTPATASPAKSWYLAGGSSRNGFDTWLLVQNPDPAAPASVKASFITDAGSVVTQPLSVPPHGRVSFYTNPVVPNADYGVHVEADRPVVVERSVYFGGGRAGFADAAVPAPGTEWYLPAGETSGSFEEQLLVLNPQSQPASVEVDLRRQDGSDVTPIRFSVGPTTQTVLDVNPYAPDTSVALRVTSDQPVVVERASFFARATGLGATTSTGVAR